MLPVNTVLHHRDGDTVLFRIGTLRHVEPVFEVVKVALESFDVCFQIFDTHQRETEELLVAFRHQRQLVTRLPRFVGVT